MALTIDWPLIRRTVWSRGGVAAILMAPNALPISFWFFETVSPIKYTFDTANVPEFIGQLILALLVGLFAAIAGLAIDIGIVKIAVSEPTHKDRFKSLTFWVPVAFCVMAWLVIYDYYSGHQWIWDMSTFTHLAYPTASMLTALYWSWSKDWVKELTGPLNEQLGVLNAQLSDWFARFNTKVEEATVELRAQVASLTEQLETQTRRAEEFERLGKGLGAIVDSTLDSQAEAHAQLRTQHQANIVSLREHYEGMIRDLKGAIQGQIAAAVAAAQAPMQAEIERLGAKVQEVQDAAGRQRERDQATIAEREATILDLQSRVVEPGVFQYLTMKEAIEAQLTTDPEVSNEQLAITLRIKPDQLGTFRSQVSQVRKVFEGGRGMAA